MTLEEAELLKDESILLTKNGDLITINSDKNARIEYLKTNKCILVTDSDYYAINFKHVFMNLGTKLITDELREAVKNEYPELFV